MAELNAAIAGLYLTLWSLVIALFSQMLVKVKSCTGY